MPSETSSMRERTVAPSPERWEAAEAELCLRPIELSVVMPCLNEAESVGVCVRKALDAMHASGISGEVIAADNGPSDGPREIAQSEGALVFHVREKGYGHAVRAGILAVHGEYVLMADSKNGYDFAHTPRRFLDKLRVGNNAVNFSQFHR